MKKVVVVKTKQKPKPKPKEKIEDADQWIEQNVLTEKQWEEYIKEGEEDTYLSYLNNKINQLWRKRQQARTENERIEIFEIEKKLGKFRSDYGHKLFEEQQKKREEREKKQKRGRDLLLKKRFDFFKDYEINDEKPISEINDKFYGIMNMNRTIIMYPSENIKNSPFYDKTYEKKTKVNFPLKKFILSSGGNKWIKNPHNEEQYYDLDEINRFAGKLDQNSLNIYHGEDSPMIIKDKNITFALAPRILEFKEKEYEITEENFNLLKKKTKKELLEKTGITNKTMGKDALVFEYVNLEKIKV